MAWTTPRTWSGGELVTAALMNPHLRDNLNASMRVLAYKSSNQTVNNSTVLVNDTALLFPVVANEVWFARFVLAFTSGATPDIKFAWTWPTGTTAVVHTVNYNAVPTMTMINVIASGTATPIRGTGVTENVVVFNGVFRVGANAGNVQLQWAQNTANVSNTTVNQGSCILGVKLA